LNETSRVDVRREAILQAAAECIAAEGLDAASITKIAKRAGVSKSLVLYHFGNKQELAREAWRSRIEKVDGQVQAQTGGPLFADIPSSFQVILKEQGSNGGVPFQFWLEYWAQATRTDDLKHQHVTRFVEGRKAIVEALQRGIERGEVRTDIDRESVAELIWALAYGFQVHLALEKESVTPHQAQQAVIQFLQLLGPVSED
jgi:AcrR family transcriptional regulator